ncbi:uncharacterized protein PAC_01234 [Phialocephala subalpina]|uniref:Beta-lactamase-related domain-containing protein n=1 Tax=Phialocephala subalpina TaxID=576137 RepID=A0A1L7WF50_9HELO|nr:uncharacterized protein PAC_01234 [Phialocephala subalpina]
MGDSAGRFRRLRTVVEELARIGGIPRLTVVVMTRGTLVYQNSFGYRDLKASLSVNDKWIFPRCSLTKAVTAAAFSLLVDEGRAALDTLNYFAITTAWNEVTASQSAPKTIAPLPRTTGCVSSMAWRDYIHFADTHFEPKGMDSIFLVTPPASADNVAKCYNTLIDGTPALNNAP